MDLDLIYAIISALVAAVVSAAVTWGTVRTEMRYFRRDIDDNKREIERVEERRREGEGKLHDRISGLNSRMTKAGVNGP